MTKTKMRTRTKVLIVLAVLVALLLAAGGGLVAIGASAVGGETIFPNVYVGGVPIGGLTVEEAAEKLAGTVTEDLTDKSVIVRFPGDSVLEVTAEQAGLSATGDEAALLAYEYGRSGGTFSNAWAYFRCRTGEVELEPSSMLQADEDMVRAVVDDAAARLTGELMTSSYEVVDDTLVITKGRLGIVFDEDRLVKLIMEAFIEGDYNEIDYETETVGPEAIDLQAIYDSLYTEPENAVYDKELGAVSDHVDGISFNLDTAQALIDSADNGAEVEIPLVYTEPEITKSELESVLFRDELCSSETSLTSNSNRNTNIELAANAINGTILNPGEQFDYNTVVGERTTAKGYLATGAYSGTESVQEVGGGICQVSSTIYHALLHTDLQVDTRRCHSLTVSYLPLGMDAAVSWGGPDFAFTNNTDYPLKITAYRDGLTLHVSIQGTDTSEYTIEPEYVYIGSVAYGTTYKDDPSLPTGQTKTLSYGTNGHVVETYKNYYDAAGNLVKTEYVDKSTYSPKDEEIARGTGAAATETPQEPATPAPDPDPDPAPEGETTE